MRTIWRNPVTLIYHCTRQLRFRQTNVATRALDRRTHRPLPPGYRWHPLLPLVVLQGPVPAQSRLGFPTLLGCYGGKCGACHSNGLVVTPQPDALHIA